MAEGGEMKVNPEEEQAKALTMGMQFIENALRRDDQRDPTLARIFEEIAKERAAQDAQWGGPEHDDAHDAAEWRRIILQHVNRLIFTPYMRASDDYRKVLVEVAALAVAAAQAYDRAATPRNETETKPAAGAETKRASIEPPQKKED
jgi:hypothetical protein